MKNFSEMTVASRPAGATPALLLGALLGATSCAVAVPVTAKKTDAVVESMSVQLHLAYDGGVYDTLFPLLKTRLQEMGVRHYRDSLENPAYKQWVKDRHNEIGLMGVRGTFNPDKGNGSNPPMTPSEALASAALVADSLEAFEGQNEVINRYVGSTMTPQAIATARQYQQDFFNAINASSRWQNYPIIGPSCVGDTGWAALGDLSAFMDYGNAHTYPLGKAPATPDSGYFAEMTAAANVAPGKQFFNTETGYQTGVNNDNNQDVSLAASGKYLPRLFLENFNRGILRSSWYELFNQGTDLGDAQQNFGLLGNDGSYKPSGTAFRNLTTLLKEATYNSTSKTWQAPAFTAGTLDYSLSGNTTNVHSTLLQKSNGKFYLCLWQELSSYDSNTNTTVNNPNVPITLNLTTPIASAISYLPTSGTTGTNLTISGGAITLSVPDQVLMVELTPGIVATGYNPSFEVDNAATQTPFAWSEYNYGSTANAAASFVEAGGQSGAYRAAHWSSSAYQVYTYQTRTGLANGTYTLSAWVQSSGGQTACYLEAKDFGGSTLRANLPTTSTWTQITIPNIQVANGQVTIGFYSNANANNWCRFDNILLSQLQAQTLTNPSFEVDNAATQTPFAWSEYNYGSTANAAASFVEAGGQSGAYRAAHWSSSAYQVYTYQTRTGLANGTYTLSAWVQSSGGQTACYLEAKDFGGSALRTNLPTTSTWTRISVPNIVVSNGQLTLGVYSNANANNWCRFDNFTLDLQSAIQQSPMTAAPPKTTTSTTSPSAKSS